MDLFVEIALRLCDGRDEVRVIAGPRSSAVEVSPCESKHLV
jgi:hypothetical protein